MKDQHLEFLLLVLFFAAPASAQQTLDWQGVEKLLPGTFIIVKTNLGSASGVYCQFESAIDTKLLCERYDGRPYWLKPKHTEVTFERDEIKSVALVPFADQGGYLDLFATLGGGSGLDANSQPTAFFNAKVGGEAGIDLEYDRLAATNAFSIEGFVLEPVFRVPKFSPNRARTFIEFYPEPAVGFRTGGGPFGGYASAGGMFVLMNDRQRFGFVAPYVEVRHRFPFNGPMEGDTRIGLGLMFGSH